MERLIKIPRFVRSLILYSCLIGALPVLILGYVSNTLYSNKLQEKVNRVSEQSLTQFQLRIEQILTMVDYSMTQFMNSHGLVAACRQRAGGEQL
ncbi:hypothetical protein [Cohnella rhizosphaerae]|uniref:Uncharacterized protein n=1 Tax=Cohnella rhizosphaerae TaxID=1457232 RepID=A0A9X4KZX2_9BACL|nr:hypothetical protein [Cohnella rhizosphaerae]MDG0813965.1 hypothetical protein [Cohnella rhizosphaerae]